MGLATEVLGKWSGRDNKLIRARFSRQEIAMASNFAKKANCKGTNCVCLSSAVSGELGEGW